MKLVAFKKKIYYLKWNKYSIVFIIISIYFNLYNFNKLKLTHIFKKIIF